MIDDEVEGMLLCENHGGDIPSLDHEIDYFAHLSISVSCQPTRQIRCKVHILKGTEFACFITQSPNYGYCDALASRSSWL